MQQKINLFLNMFLRLQEKAPLWHYVIRLVAAWKPTTQFGILCLFLVLLLGYSPNITEDAVGGV